MNTTIILIAYNGDQWLPDCINSLQNASRRRLHLVLVDNSGNTVIDQLDLSPFDVEILQTPEPMGFAEANNYALVNASHLEEIVLFLNQDTISPKGWIDSCRGVLKSDSEIGALSPVIRNYDSTAWDPSFLDCLNTEQENSLDEGGGNQIIEVMNTPAPALLVRSEVLKKTGPFDPIYGSYYEDYDLCRRIRDTGYSIAFTSSAYIRHYSGGSTQSKKQRRKRMKQIIRNRIIYEIRQSNHLRFRTLFKYFMIDFPRRLMRGIFNTPSSQPPIVTFTAYISLIRMFYRLLSSTIDKIQWKKYLHSINWDKIY